MSSGGGDLLIRMNLVGEESAKRDLSQFEQYVTQSVSRINALLARPVTPHISQGPISPMRIPARAETLGGGSIPFTPDPQPFSTFVQGQSPIIPPEGASREIASKLDITPEVNALAKNFMDRVKEGRKSLKAERKFSRVLNRAAALREKDYEKRSRHATALIRREMDDALRAEKAVKQAVTDERVARAGRKRREAMEQSFFNKQMKAQEQETRSLARSANRRNKRSLGGRIVSALTPRLSGGAGGGTAAQKLAFAGSSAAIGLAGQAGFPALNVAFATMSGGALGGALAAAATAAGEFTRAVLRWGEEALASAESAGLLSVKYKEAVDGIEEEKARRGTILSSLLEEQKEAERERLKTLSDADGLLLLWNANLSEMGSSMSRGVKGMMADAALSWSDVVTMDMPGSTKKAVKLFTETAAEEAEVKQEQARKKLAADKAVEKENKELTSFARRVLKGTEKRLTFEEQANIGYEKLKTAKGRELISQEDFVKGTQELISRSDEDWFKKRNEATAKRNEAIAKREEKAEKLRKKEEKARESHIDALIRIHKTEEAVIAKRGEIAAEFSDRRLGFLAEMKPEGAIADFLGIRDIAAARERGVLSEREAATVIGRRGREGDVSVGFSDPGALRDSLQARMGKRGDAPLTEMEYKEGVKLLHDAEKFSAALEERIALAAEGTLDAVKGMTSVPFATFDR